MSQMPFPSREQAVTRYLLERQARDHPDDLYMRFQDGSEWTFAEALEQAHHAAAALARLGVKVAETSGAPPVSPGETTVSISLDVVFELGK